jgi:hypothetical protein
VHAPSLMDGQGKRTVKWSPMKNAKRSSRLRKIWIFKYILYNCIRYYDIYIILVVVVVFIDINLLDYIVHYRSLSYVYGMLWQTTERVRVSTENYLKGTSLPGYPNYFGYVDLHSQVIFS